VPELDRIVADARAAGALGARMTGGGFGGCAVVAWRGRRPEALKPVVASIFTGD
jgi:galactokinase